MAWVGGKLRCDRRLANQGRRRSCTNHVAAETHGSALHRANQAGWWRGNRGGWTVDYCPEHSPDRGKRKHDR